MMNELNKRANLLIEQLEVITFFSLYFVCRGADEMECAEHCVILL